MKKSLVLGLVAVVFGFVALDSVDAGQHVKVVVQKQCYQPVKVCHPTPVCHYPPVKVCYPTPVYQPCHVYYGQSCHFWTTCCYEPTYGCQVYYSPTYSCNFYWCAPHNCYYPVSYCPLGRYTF